MAVSFKSAGHGLGSAAPEVTDPDAHAVLSWTRQQFQELIPRLNAPSDLRLTVLTSEPGKPREAQLAYADGTGWNPGQGAGLYLFNGTTWLDLLSGLLVSTFMRTVLDDTTAVAALATLGVTTGVWTPTLVNGANVAASTSYAGQFFRVNDRFLAFGRADIDPTAAAPTTTVLGIPPPAASNFGSSLDCHGVGNCMLVNQSGAIQANTGSDYAEYTFLATSTANAAHWYSFTGKVI